LSVKLRISRKKYSGSKLLMEKIIDYYFEREKKRPAFDKRNIGKLC